MANNSDNDNRMSFTGLWLRENRAGTSKYYTSAMLKPDDIARLIEWIKRPTKIMIFSNNYKKTDKHPDANIFLYHIDDNWKPSQKPTNTQETQQPEPEQQNLPDAPF